MLYFWLMGGFFSAGMAKNIIKISQAYYYFLSIKLQLFPPKDTFVWLIVDNPGVQFS